MDSEALAAVGLRLPPGQPVPAGAAQEQFRLIPAARSVLTRLRTHTGGRRPGVRHVMLARLALQPPDPGAVLLDRLDVDLQAVPHRLEAR